MTEEEVESFRKAAIARLEERQAKQHAAGELINAVRAGEMDTFKSLLEHGADPDEQDGFGYTVLHHVAGRRSMESTLLLLNKGADPNRQDENGLTPLMMAVICNADANATLLLERGADLELKNERGDTALIIAAGDGDRIDAMRVLIEKGAFIDHKGDEGGTALSLAVMNGYTEMVRLLIDKGADLYIKDDRGLTAVDYAKVAGYPDIALLMKKTVATRQHLAAEKARADEAAKLKREEFRRAAVLKKQRGLRDLAPVVTIDAARPKP